MKTLTLKNGELFDLQIEINDVIEKSKSFTTKYYLNNLFSQLESNFKNVETAKNEIIKKYGKEDKNGAISVEQFVDKDAEVKEFTESFKSFLVEFNEFRLLETDVEFTPLKLSIFENISTDKFYPVLFKFIKE